MLFCCPLFAVRILNAQHPIPPFNHQLQWIEDKIAAPAPEILAKKSVKKMTYYLTPSGSGKKPALLMAELHFDRSGRIIGGEIWNDPWNAKFPSTISSFSYDAQGCLNSITTTELDIISGEEVKKDSIWIRCEAGRPMEKWYYSQNGNHITQDQINKKRTYTYDPQGRLIREERFEATQESGFEPKLIDRYEWAYSKDGNTVKRFHSTIAKDEAPYLEWQFSYEPEQAEGRLELATRHNEQGKEIGLISFGYIKGHLPAQITQVQSNGRRSWVSRKMSFHYHPNGLWHSWYNYYPPNNSRFYHIKYKHYTF